MNALRGGLSVFMLAIVASAALGWHWAGRLPEAKLEGARVVLTVAILACLGALSLIWTAKPQKSLS